MVRGKPVSARTLAGLLRARALAPDSHRIALCCRAGGAWSVRTWAEYWDGVCRVAAGLQAAGIRPGSNVLVLVPEVEPAVCTLFGAWTIGAVPIQVGLPFRLADVGAFVAQLRKTALRLEARAIVVSRSLAAFAGDDRSPPILVAEDLLTGSPGPQDAEPDRFAKATALIQLTSGSTGHPRGVVVSHDRLMRHLNCMSRVLPSHAHSVAVSWLPLHHDMGLVGGLLFPFYNGFPVHLLSPADFRARPLSWLETMDRVRGTICAAPPSAYAVLAALARKAGGPRLDFSSWECAMVGAEPISADVLRRFADAFSPAGFRANAFFPVYGLAEATVAVTFPALLAPTRLDRVDRETLEREGRAAPSDRAGAIDLVGVGRPIPETQVRVVDAEGEEVADWVVGEILVRSTTLMRGYFDDPEASSKALVDGWLRTGDLGYLADGELFVTGRLKDVIIRGGANLIPSTIEEVAAGVDGVRGGGVAAVGLRTEGAETEAAWLLVETAVEGDAARTALVLRVDAELKAHGIVVDRIVLLTPGSLPKTTSGKLRRGEAAAAASSGAFA